MDETRKNPAHKRKDRGKNRTHLFSPLFHTRRWRGQVSFCGSSVHVSCRDGQDITLHQHSNKWQQQQSHVNLTKCHRILHKMPHYSDVTVCFLNLLYLCHIRTQPNQKKKMPHFSNHSNTVLHVAPQLWHASNVNSTSCSIMSHDTYRRGSATRLLLTMWSSFCKKGNGRSVRENCFHSVQINNPLSADRPPPKKKSTITRR